MDEITRFGVGIYIDTEEDNPRLLSNKLGINATKMLAKDEPMINSKGKIIPNKYYSSNIWIYEIQEIKSREKHLNHAIEQIVELLVNKKDQFLDAFKKYSKYKLQCYSYFHEVNPYFVISKEIIKRLNEFEIDIEFDIYCLNDD